MALGTFDELKATVADYLNRADLTAAIPTFVSLAEVRLNRDLRTRFQDTMARSAKRRQLVPSLKAGVAPPASLGTKIMQPG